MIAGELDKCTQCLFFCTRQVTYELWAFAYGFGVRAMGGVTTPRQWALFFFDIKRKSDIRIFRLDFGVMGRVAQWRALTLLLGRARAAFRHGDRRNQEFKRLCTVDAVEI